VELPGQRYFTAVCIFPHLCRPTYPDTSHPIAGILSDKTGAEQKGSSLLNGPPPLNDSDQHDDNGDDQQDMNKVTHRIATHQPQQPQNYQYDGNRPQHVILLPDCSFPLPAIASPFDGHPVLYPLHTVYVLGEFSGQVQFSYVAGLAIQGDHATLCLNLGIEGAGRAVR